MGFVYSYPFLPEMMTIWHITVFVIGACVGSFLNVCIWRIPRDESVVVTPSHCPHCNRDLSWYENIPLVSWICLGGKCRVCKVAIPFRYFFVELLTAVMFSLVWAKLVINGESIAMMIPYVAVTILVITTTYIDAEHFFIPDEITYSVALTGIVSSLIFPEIWGTSSRIWALSSSCGGLVAGAGVFAIFAIVGKSIFKVEALGWGDVKFLGAVGACLGVKACFFTVLVGSITGTVAGLALMITKKKMLKTVIPFGPYLAAGAYIWMLYGNRLIDLYLNWLKQLSPAMIWFSSN